MIISKEIASVDLAAPLHVRPSVVDRTFLDVRTGQGMCFAHNYCRYVDLSLVLCTHHIDLSISDEWYAVTKACMGISGKHFAL